MLDGSLRIFELQAEVEVEDHDRDSRAFVAVVSETEHLPSGTEALNLSVEALARKESDVRRAREWAIGVVREPCESLIAGSRTHNEIVNLFSEEKIECCHF